MLEKIFENILNQKKYFSKARNGQQFEECFKNHLKQYGFSEIIKEDLIETISNLEETTQQDIKQIWQNIKNKILAKNSEKTIPNHFKNIKSNFIFQPNGSQNFPDFVIFTNNCIIPIEIKYSKNTKNQPNFSKLKPMWNSNIPKSNAIYIFGVALKTVTFFKGSDILNQETRKVLLGFFSEIDIQQKKASLDQELSKLQNNFGLYPYVRKAYEHKGASESYFSQNAPIREKNVLDFLRRVE